MKNIKTAILTFPLIGKLIIYVNKVRLTGTLEVGVLSHEDKSKLILEYAKNYNAKNFVETGTFKGDTVQACLNDFEKLYSIELSHELFEESKARFSGNTKVQILQGNSGDILPNIVNKDTQTTLFWLDAHYSEGKTAKGEKDSPIIEELEYIFGLGKPHCILIDDARCFNGKSGYPRIKALRDMIKEKTVSNLNFQLSVKNDIIRIVPVNNA